MSDRAGLDASIVVVAQIEGPAGVTAAAEISAVRGLDVAIVGPYDVAIVGPYDLAESLGAPGEVRGPGVVAAAERVAAAVDQHVALPRFGGD